MYKYRIIMMLCGVANVEMKVFEFVALVSLIVAHSNVKAFLNDLFTTNFDPFTVHCKRDADCMRDIDPPCFCVRMQHICGCHYYGVGTIHQDIKKNIIPSTTNAPVPEVGNKCSRKVRKTKKTKKPRKNYIDDDMIRQMEK